MVSDHYMRMHNSSKVHFQPEYHQLFYTEHHHYAMELDWPWSGSEPGKPGFDLNQT